MHAGVGPVSLSDVDLAETCGASIICFNTRSMPAAVEAATRQANIDVSLLLVQMDIIFIILNIKADLWLLQKPCKRMITLEILVSSHRTLDIHLYIFLVFSSLKQAVPIRSVARRDADASSFIFCFCQIRSTK